jgi:hypothetical protein
VPLSQMAACRPHSGGSVIPKPRDRFESGCAGASSWRPPPARRPPPAGRSPRPQASYTKPRVADPKRLSAFRKLAGWGPDGAAAKGQLPMMFLMAEGFRLVMSVLTLPTFPVSILGTVVNKKAKYSLLRAIPEGERLLYRWAWRGRDAGGGGSGLGLPGKGGAGGQGGREGTQEAEGTARPAANRRRRRGKSSGSCCSPLLAAPASVPGCGKRRADPRPGRRPPPPPPYCSARLVPAVRETFSGHAEFDIVLEASSADKGDAVWQAVLTLVLMNPKKGKGHGGGDKKKVGGAGGLAASFLRLCRCLRRRAGGSRPGAGAKGRAGRRASCCGRHGAGAGAAKADATGE